MEFEKKTQSKAYYFFDRLFRIFICNIFCVASMAVPVALYILLLIDLGQSATSSEITTEVMQTLMLLFWIATTTFLVFLPFTIMPAIVSSTAVIKDNVSGVPVWKSWFYEFKSHYLKSMLMGLVYAVLFGIVVFSLYFYSICEPTDINIIDHFNITGTNILFIITAQMQEHILQAGFVVSGIFMIALTLLVVHVPMLVITLPRLSVGDLLKTNVFMAINYFINTIVLVAMLLISIVGLTFFPIWIVFGISLPMLIGIRFSKVNYRELEKVDFDKINKQIDEDLEEDE